MNAKYLLSELNSNSLSLVLLGLSIGLILSLMGAGGALIAVPTLIFLLDYELEIATTVSAIIVLIGAISSLIFRRGLRALELKTALQLSMFGFLGNFLGSFLFFFLPNLLIYIFLVITMSISILLMATRGELSNQTKSTIKPTFLVGVGFLAGLLSGLLGVGGGFVLVPALVKFANKELRDAVGISLAFILLNSLLAIYLRRESLELILVSDLVALILAMVLATFVVSLFFPKFKERSLSILYIALISICIIGIIIYRIIPEIELL